VTSSDSATGMSKGVWVSSACMAIMKIDEAHELGEDERVADAAPAEDLALVLGHDDALQVQVPAWMTTPTTASMSGSS
jgi:hypothetical protein